MRQNIFAWTAPGSYPEYISVNAGDDKGGAAITVRSVGGGLATIDLDREQLAALGRALLDHAGEA